MWACRAQCTLGSVASTLRPTCWAWCARCAVLCSDVPVEALWHVVSCVAELQPHTLCLICALLTQAAVQRVALCRGCLGLFAWLHASQQLLLPCTPLQVSAALASASMLLKKDSPALASSWLTHAQQLHSWATEKPGKMWLGAIKCRQHGQGNAGGWGQVCMPSVCPLVHCLRLCSAACIGHLAFLHAHAPLLLPAGLFCDSLPSYQPVKQAGLVPSSRSELLACRPGRHGTYCLHAILAETWRRVLTCCCSLQVPGQAHAVLGLDVPSHRCTCCCSAASWLPCRCRPCHAGSAHLRPSETSRILLPSQAHEWHIGSALWTPLQAMPRTCSVPIPTGRRRAITTTW